MLGKQARSLAGLTRACQGLDLDKTARTADWRQRPLPPACISYARADVHFLLHLAGLLRWAGTSACAPQAAACLLCTMLTIAHKPPCASSLLRCPTLRSAELSSGGATAVQPQQGALRYVLHRSQQLTLALYTKPRHDAVVAAAAAGLLKAAASIPAAAASASCTPQGHGGAAGIRLLHRRLHALCAWRDWQARKGQFMWRVACVCACVCTLRA